MKEAFMRPAVTYEVSGVLEAPGALRWSVKAPLRDPESVKGAFTDPVIVALVPDAPVATAVTAEPREGPLHAAQPRELDLHTLPKYMKASFLAPGARKEAFMYFKREGGGPSSVGVVVSGKSR
ncbi:hypothetical protein [Amycolatopsis azurea]|uniref:hypothetical protein n=2 Tax=Amycolatopsis azurea TaxID=36819 RepID=UPI0005871B0B|nr:hypothetical protein [Amycolatopsis azurea]